MDAKQIKAPFTAEQVKALNDFQHGPWHPFTCGTVGCHQTIKLKNYDRPFEVSTTLIATEAGWICPNCDYTQNWAWDFMADPYWTEHFKLWLKEVTNAKGNEGAQSL